MKRIIGFILGLTLVVASCDVITEPYAGGGAGPGEVKYNDTVYNDTTVNKRRILLEEFTGHKCPNCPEGADIATQIKTDHPEDFLSVSIHNSGSFSKVDLSNPAHPYPSDFETATGERLRIKYKHSAFPGGMLNRTEINSTPKVPYRSWVNEVQNLLNDATYMAPRFKLHLENIYNSKLGERSLRIRYKATAIQDVTGNIAIACYVLEGKIIAPQVDNRLNDSYVHDYEHNHVLRVGFPGDGAGKTLFNNPTNGEVAEVISENDEISVALNDEWKPENMNVIVFLFNSDTGEILHVEETHLTN
tara:strand:- start:10350 stop:11258 length:909 start_codon:yes stop_codon:yes gene_type:complete